MPLHKAEKNPLCNSAFGSSKYQQQIDGLLHISCLFRFSLSYYRLFGIMQI